MSYTEKNITHENGAYFVLKTKTSYDVMVNGLTHSLLDSAYPLDDDGLSLAKARANYLAGRPSAYKTFRAA